VTWGDVQLFQVDPNTQVETPLGTMRPAETTGQYRQYYVNGLGSNCCGATPIQVSVQCKLDFTPVYSDSDYLLIQSIPALADECMSIRYGRMDTAGAAQLSAAKHANALRLLLGQIDHMEGREQIAIRRSLFGSERLIAQPV
jgi:hypothetical protein